MIITTSVVLFFFGFIFLIVGFLDRSKACIFFGSTVMLCALVFGLGVLGNEIDVDSKYEKVHNYTITEMGIIVEHSAFDHKIVKLTDFKLIDSMKTGENDLYIQFDLNSYGTPVYRGGLLFFAHKKDSTEKDIDKNPMLYKVKAEQ
jgi:hypothetical protein